MNEFISDVKKEFNDLLEEKEANREMKLVKRLADKKILLTFIIGVFIFVTMLVNLISNSIDGIFLSLAGGKSEFNLLFNLFMPNLSYPLLYLLAYGVMILVLGKVIFNFKASFKDIKEGQKGNSRFTTMEEIKEQYKCVNEVETSEERELGGYEGKGGVIIARDKDKVFIDDSPTNNLIIGTTRSGKGELFVFPSIDLYSRAEKKASLVVNDPKAELYGASKEILEARGYRVEVLNLILPMNSMSYNPLQLVIDAYEKNDYSTAQSLCKTLTHMLYYKPDVKDPFWPNSAMSLVNALILAVIEECFNEDKVIKERIDNLNCEKEKLIEKEGQAEKYDKLINEIDSGILELEEERVKVKSKITLYTVANMLSELGSKTDIKGNNELDKYFAKLPAKSVAKMQYATSNFSKGEARGSIFSVAMSELNIFTMDEIAKLTSKNSINLKDIGFKSEDNRPVALFMTIPDFDKSNHVIASIFVRQLYYVLAKEATFNIPAKCDREVIFLLDEFGSMPAIEGMDSIITVCLGRNIKFNLVIQAISQLKKLYGDDYKTILGNCSNKFYIFTNEVETAEEFSKLLGDKTIVTYSRSGEILDTTKHQTESVDGRKLLTTDELMHLKEGEIAIVRGTKRRDIKGNKIRPFPIFNTEEHTLKYRYEYLGSFFDNTKNLINEKIDTLHENVILEDLILFKDRNKNEVKNKNNIQKNQIGIINKSTEKYIELGNIFTLKEIDEINRAIEMVKQGAEIFDSNSEWSRLCELATEINNEKLNYYIELGKKVINRMK
ncbi:MULTISPECIES: VirD4-like conjugal transfer protein, CD1115 family [Clostridium]|uniref:VirD4-like conjugal transfer protein, CD1115 family n=1 Tax=Clostridium TaxID=1485 RepID=UPI00232AC0DB|nr:MULTISPECIES: type IV secretory system conjugative DNA transfer family protein [Clostridium]MDB2104829.1 type IV secretory system conjugative DNA transfer family protein [Clostridium paraputrificum]MDU4727958.1 type IV secretory system conjugative DNA transfer family protein [Clostridium sp.]